LPETSILAYFSDVDDPRIGKNRKHALINIITIAVLGVICGADNWVNIERHGRAKAEWLGQLLDLSNGIPSHDSFKRVSRWLDGERFEQQFIAWTRHRCALIQGQLVALDGETL